MSFVKAYRLPYASTAVTVKLTLKSGTPKSVFTCLLALYQGTLYQIWKAEKDKARWYELRFVAKMSMFIGHPL